MPLTLVSTPIGNPEDITLRAIRILKECDGIICEEWKPAKILFKQLGIPEKPLYQLNEHSTNADLTELVELCASQNMALISNCGTPGFCDPGQGLIAELRKRSVTMTTAPGVSSLTTALSLAGFPVDRFRLVGFLSPETGERMRQVKRLVHENEPLVFLDTPYRLNKLLGELAQVMGNVQATLALNLTLPEEKIVSGALKQLASQTWPKSEFILVTRAPQGAKMPEESRSQHQAKTKHGARR